ncbi:hypothetical protein VTI74DRAFT_4408 [Chaetomium olivicolor]
MRYKQGRAYAKEALMTLVWHANFCSHKFRQGWAEDLDKIGTIDDLLEAYIELYNDCICKLPADFHTGKLFAKLKVNTFYLEYDIERAGGFELRKFLPKDRNNTIHQAADFVAEGSGQTREEALKRILVSPQCGFSTHESGYPLSEEDEKKKLALIPQIADEIWGEP